jgi:predicted DNA-binding transcriptional regulator AlpA
MTSTNPNPTGRKAVGEVLWSKKDLAAYLGISESGLNKQIDRGAVPPFIRVGRLIRWVPEIARDYYSPKKRSA